MPLYESPGLSLQPRTTIASERQMTAQDKDTCDCYLLSSASKQRTPEMSFYVWFCELPSAWSHLCSIGPRSLLKVPFGAVDEVEVIHLPPMIRWRPFCLARVKATRGLMIRPVLGALFSWTPTFESLILSLQHMRDTIASERPHVRHPKG
jgi:hypothetical protein